MHRLYDGFVCVVVAHSYTDIFRAPTPKPVAGRLALPTPTAGGVAVVVKTADDAVSTSSADEASDTSGVDCNPCSVSALSTSPVGATSPAVAGSSRSKPSRKRGAAVALQADCGDVVDKGAVGSDSAFSRMQQGLAALLSPARGPRLPSLPASLPRVPSVSLGDVQDNVQWAVDALMERTQQLVPALEAMQDTVIRTASAVKDRTQRYTPSLETVQDTMKRTASAVKDRTQQYTPSLETVQDTVKRTMDRVVEAGQHYASEAFKGVEAFAATFDSQISPSSPSFPMSPRAGDYGTPSAGVGCGPSCMPRLTLGH